MIFFITCLRALAAIVITNSHYTGVYPTDLIANGGLLGDIVFFAVSGYCLFNVKGSFPKWYGKRIYRIYPPVIIITTIYLVTGAYDLNKFSFLGWFIYPTNYHFIGSIIFLYILYYIVMKVQVLRNHLELVMFGVFIVWLSIYIFVYDKSYYHIDNVYEYIIRFLFFESMLLGAWFRKEDKKFRNTKHKVLLFLASVVTASVYFASKILFVRFEKIAFLQILNPIAIFITLFFVFAFFSSVDSKLEQLPKALKAIIKFLSDITLEIYVVQVPIIAFIKPIGHFPLNWLAITVSIVVSAWLLHEVCKLFYKACASLAGLFKRLRMIDE